MNKIRTLLLVAFVTATALCHAQFTQENPRTEFMMKVEANYLHFTSNAGTPGTNGYNLNATEEGAGLNFALGANISQDFFLGGGLGYNYMAPAAHLDRSSQEFHAFLDFDFRPIITHWTPFFGPVKTDWSPMLGLRAGGSFLMNANNYGTTMSPYLEFYAGINWFYDHALKQMTRNYHSWYLQTGVVLFQQTVFIPIQLGWRL